VTEAFQRVATWERFQEHASQMRSGAAPQYTFLLRERQRERVRHVAIASSPQSKDHLHPLPITSTGTSSSFTGKRGSLPGAVDAGKRSRAFSNLAGRSESVEKLWSSC